MSLCLICAQSFLQRIPAGIRIATQHGEGGLKKEVERREEEERKLRGDLKQEFD